MLDNATGISIQGEGCRCCVGSIPGTIETEGGISSSGNCAIVGSVGYRDIAAGLRIISAPELSNRLSIGKCPGQRPTIDGC